MTSFDPVPYVADCERVIAPARKRCPVGQFVRVTAAIGTSKRAFKHCSPRERQSQVGARLRSARERRIECWPSLIRDEEARPVTVLCSVLCVLNNSGDFGRDAAL